MDNKTASLYLLVLLAVLQAVMTAILQNKQHTKSKRDRILHVLISPKLGYKPSTGKFEVPQNANLPWKQRKELTATDSKYEQELTTTDLKYEQDLIATDMKYEQPNEMSQTPMAAEFDYSKQTNITHEFPPHPNHCKRCDYPYACSIGHIIGNCVPYGFGCRCVPYPRDIEDELKSLPLP